MEKEFIQLSNKVVKSADGNQYFAKVDSAETFKKTFYDEESQYEVSARNTEIQLMNADETYTPSILISFCKEDNGSCFYVDVIISSVLGTFISDRY